MKIKTSETTPIQINWLVAEALNPGDGARILANEIDFIQYHEDWAQGGPISEREGISSQKENDGWWVACIYDINEEPKHYALSHSRLEAEMRCYVASRLGDEVEVPDELA